MKPSSAVLLFALLLAPAADAAPDAAALAKKGMAAMAAGKPAQACPLFEKSYAKDPKPSTLFALAQCEEKRGHAALAFGHYQAYVELVNASAGDHSSEAVRMTVADQQLDELSKKLAEVTLVLPPDAPAGSVKLDGRVVTTASPVHVEPGEHAVAFEGGADKTPVKFTVGAGEKKRIALGGADAAAPPAPLPPAAAHEEPSLAAPPPTAGKEAAPPAPHRSHTTAWIVGGVGLAGVATGAVFGALAMGRASVVDAHCKTDVLCDAQGKQAGDQGKLYGWISTGGFAAGALLLGASLYLLLDDSSSAKTASARPRVQPAVQPVATVADGGAWAGVRGAF